MFTKEFPSLLIAPNYISMKKVVVSRPFKFQGLIVLMMTFVFSLSFAQNPYTLQFQNKTIEIPENIDSFEWSQMPESSKLDNGYYGWVQFYETPNQIVQDRFRLNNLQLLEYIPNKAYLFYFPETTSISFLKQDGVRSIVPVSGDNKLSFTLKNGPYGDWATEGDNILVTLQHHKNVNTEYVINNLATQQISVKNQYRGSNNIDLSIPNNCLEALSNLPYVKWVELIVAPSVPDDTPGRSLHRASNLDTQTGIGRNYTGAGIGVMCRDDGAVGPHIDFQGRITGIVNVNSGSHGDGVSGVMAGAGNLDPSNRGTAAGANLLIVNYEANFLDALTVRNITDGTTQITNSSQSEGCNTGYTTTTQTVDQQIRDNPTVLHVFSAGNSNNNDCGYGAGNQWGNITGGNKQGKNAIATANVFFDGSLVNSSSRGPAHDGRIKPDIAANGGNQISTGPNNTYQTFGGTSGASPGIAGISAQLYELYGDLNGGALPPSALIKAALLNTANPAGNGAPNYKFGWGIVNALRAGMLIEDGRYLSDNISQGGTNNHTISVPADTHQVRFMVYWSDPAASPGASPSLVNDLDMVVTDPSSGMHLPLVLDETPDPITLDLPAQPGVDRLNNVEQVRIHNPGAGGYNIEISGFNVPMGPQEYFIVYEIITIDNIVTYPNGGESFVPGETVQLHWDGVTLSGLFAIYYSTDNGTNWNLIDMVLDDVFTYAWTVPNTVTGEALIRIVGGSFGFSDSTFSIAEQADNILVTQVCPTSATISWNPVTGAESYDVYMLGTNYMEVVGNSTTTSLNVAVADPTEPIWAAVVAKNDTEGWKSRRTIAINHPGGLLNCSLTNDISMESINNDVTDFSLACSTGNNIVSVTIKNNGTNAQSNFPISYQISGEPEVVETYSPTLNAGEQTIYEFNTPANITLGGGHIITTSVSLASDEYVLNNNKDLSFIAYLNASSPIFLEPFDVNGVPPSLWAIKNPDNLFTWEERNNIIGSDGNPTVAAYVNNSNYLGYGQQDYLTTDMYDLTNLTSGVLNFDLAKAQYSASESDILYVSISTDCGDSFALVYGLHGLALSTIPNYNTTNNWAPQAANEWRTEQIDLSSFAGEQIIIRFHNLNSHGNSTYIDNVFIDGILATKEFNASDLSIYPNPASQGFTIDLGNTAPDTIDVIIVNSLGQQLKQYDSYIFNGNSQANFDISNFASGLYFVTIHVDGVEISKKLLIK